MLDRLKQSRLPPYPPPLGTLSPSLVAGAAPAFTGPPISDRPYSDTCLWMSALSRLGEMLRVWIGIQYAASRGLPCAANAPQRKVSQFATVIGERSRPPTRFFAILMVGREDTSVKVSCYISVRRRRLTRVPTNSRCLSWGQGMLSVV